MRDKDFKELSHFYKEGYKRFHWPHSHKINYGYVPDYVLSSGNNYVILECDQGSSRKHILGALVRASFFLQGDRSGILVAVIKPNGNTTIPNIEKQFKIYYRWIKPITNLSEVWLIEDTSYVPNDTALQIGSKEFKKFAIRI